MASSLFFVGTYTKNTASEGVYAVRLEHGTGAMTILGHGPSLENPSYLALDTKKNRLYAACEIGEGYVAALSFDPQTGAMTQLNRQPSLGADPCHVALDPKGRCLLAANYSSGTVARFALLEGGALGTPTSAQHVGSGPNKGRQEKAHAHSFTPDSSGKFAYACDLGVDKIFTYRVDRGSLEPGIPPFIDAAPGAGPRHFAWHPKGKWAYVVNELDLTVTLYARDGRTGALTPLQTVPALPRPKTEADTAADIHLSPSGRFLYSSNRGHDSLAIFAVNGGNGMLTLLGHEPTQGKTPRNFALSPQGDVLIAANQNSDSLVAFSVNQKTGKLQAIGQLKVPAPVCVKFAS